jgi:hypothetical protein
MANDDNIKKRDMEIILEVNRKAIEIETAVAEQNEEIITHLEDGAKRDADMEEKMEKLVTNSERTSKDLFRIQVLFVTGLLSLIVQIIEMFIKK